MRDAVNELLERLGHGPFRQETVVFLPGRNENIAGTTTSGVDVFAKRIVARSGAQPTVIGRALAFDRFMRSARFTYLRSPTTLGYDEHERIVLFQWISNASTGAELVDDGGFDTTLARQLGAALGELHGAESEDPHLIKGSAVFPSVRHLTGIPLEYFLECSGGLLHAWRLLQSDPALVTALTKLLESEASAVGVPVHGDLRLDQILVVGGAVHIADWEEFRIGDAARDLGALVGEWLFRSILGIGRSSADDVGDLAELSHDLILERGVQRIHEARPILSSFWSGYTHLRPSDDGRELSVRAVAFAGWHLFDRVLATAEQRSDLTPLLRAIAGVGRNALLHPENFVEVLGLGRGPC
ncbi:class V lanthionine synthetase subunit LxmK [Solihabitans fulvus]|uniref:class V lanthionine synthetase subunit LxmK n=1 Tax=Solihabitans fulvus TaxID=1892852 RepID=UPI0016621BDA|nr:class V lanthionine synthetase subunit LxmK [Solihabitans fulvus]